MAYRKQSWKNNDPSTPLSAARLNHIENGIASAELTPGEAGPAGAPGDPGPAGQDAVVTPADPVNDATGAGDVVARFNELLGSLRSAGYIRR